MHERSFARVGPMRAKRFFYLCGAIALFLAYRLCTVQVIDNSWLSQKALDQRADTIDVFARRGAIVDRDGNVLVRSLPSQSIYAVPHDLADVDSTVARLQSVVGKLDPATVAALHDRTQWFVWVARKVRSDELERVRTLNLPGVQIKQEKTGKRFDAVGEMASTVLGFVGTDENGLDGLEYEFDDMLRGHTGRVTLETDQFGRPLPFGHEWVAQPAVPGLSLQLTLDSYLQFVAEEALGVQVKKYHALDGTAIVMDPWSGEILAMADVPHFDPNRFWAFADTQRRDRAVMDAYEPGSTYKLLTAAAGLDSGKITTQMRFPARDTLQIGGRVIHNAEDGFIASTHSTESLEEIIEYSHNVGAAEVGMRMGGRTFYDMERRAGFGSATEVELPGENPGIVPPPAEWSDSSLPTMAFGQGVSVTPLAMVRFYSAIANGGMLMRPRILQAIDDDSGRALYRYPPEIEHRVFSQRTAATLRRFLRTAVVYGTGNPTAQIPGYTTAGKTGTAQMVVNGRYQPGAYASSFIGMIPAEHPRYVIYVKIERPVGAYYGGVVAAPVFTEIARAAMLHQGILPEPTPMPKRSVRRP